MQSFLAKCAALGIVAGGFTLTGDVGRLAERGRRLLEARTVPSETPSDELPREASADPSLAVTAAPAGRAYVSETKPSAPSEPVPANTASATDTLPGVALLDAPVGRAVAVPTPPSKGPEAIDLRRVPPGSRVLVWVRRPGVSSRARAMDLVALDLIDPNTGEALEHRHAALSHGSEPTTVHAAPRRVVIGGSATAGIAKGGTLRVTPVHGIAGLGREETVGTVMALEIQGR